MIFSEFPKKYLFLIFIFACTITLPAQNETWVDSLEQYALYKFLPAKNYRWTWQNAALLNTIKVQHENSEGTDGKSYLAYLRTAMDRKFHRANGRTPNAVASGLGMAYLARVTKEAPFKKAALAIYEDYQKIPKTPEGGISHLKNFTELWDDTIFMVGCYLREMYLLTGDEKYLEELILQIEIHREKLQDPESGLWFHAWDGDNKNRSNFICGQKGWSDNPEKRSQEIWGRANGWVIVTLAETVRALPHSSEKRIQIASYLKEMLVLLPELQDKSTGHWYQLPIRKDEAGNFIESSCTAMFAFGILVGLEEKIIEGQPYEKALKAAYEGLRKHSIEQVKGELRTLNVCNGTCIGDKSYYFNRRRSKEKSFGLAMFILFGKEYLKALAKENIATDPLN